MIKEVDYHSFIIAIEKGITIVEFGAPRCAPCRVQEPILEELSIEWTDKITFAKVNADKESELVAKYGIQGIPTLVIFKEGKKVDSLRGLHYKEEIKSKLKSII